MNLHKLTNEELDRRIMYLVEYGRDLAALDNALHERKRRGR